MSDSPFQNTQVKMTEGGVEVAGQLNMYVKSPAYAKIMIKRAGTKSVSINVISTKLGVFNVPKKYLQQINDRVNKKANERIAEMPGLYNAQLDYRDGHDVFKGAVPAEVKSTASGWIDLLLK